MSNNNQHLTEKELIEYQFRLCSEDQSKATAEHLESCHDCRQELAKLNCKFASLDLLRDEITVPNELISEILLQAKKPAKTKNFLLRKPIWFSVAAMLLLGLLLVISQPDSDNLQQNGAPIEPVASRETMQEDETVASLPAAMDMAQELTAAKAETAETTLVASDTAAVESFENNFRTNDTTEGIRTQSEMAGRGAMAGGFGGSDRGGAGGGRGEMLAPSSPAEPTAELESIEEADTATLTELAAEQDIDERPPFAPASAIELVTLPRRENVQLTIYNSADLTLVRENRNLTLKRGWNWLQFMWENTLIDPTSLNLEPLEQKSQIDIEQLVFPARLRQIGRWLIRSEVSGQVPFEITYLTSGLSWRAFYMGTLSEDETSLQMKGYVRVSNNSGDNYENAQTRLVVGQVHMLDEIAELAQRQYPYDSPILLTDDGYGYYRDLDEFTNLSQRSDSSFARNVLSFAGSERKKEIIKEGLSEYFLYTIEGTETIENQWAKRLLSFEANDIEVESLYKYDQGRWGDETIKFVTFANDQDHNLGETPIPDGEITIYGLADQQGYLSYVGGTDIKYIPVNEEVELNLGSARLVEVEPTLMDYKTDNFLFDPNDNIAGWDEIRTWKIEITNTRTIPVDIEITRDFGTTYWALESETSYEQYDVTRARFNLTIEPRTKREIEYTVTTNHGMREDEVAQQESDES
ncbi:DUF4139 domain-containing protein [Planctomycetota bacterium]